MAHVSIIALDQMLVNNMPEYLTLDDPNNEMANNSLIQFHRQKRIEEGSRVVCISCLSFKGTWYFEYSYVLIDLGVLLTNMFFRIYRHHVI